MQISNNDDIRKLISSVRWDWVSVLSAFSFFSSQGGFKGPEVITVGPYRPIHLLHYSCRLQDVYPRAVVNRQLLPSLSLEATLNGYSGIARSVSVILRSGSKSIVKEQTISINTEKGEVKSIGTVVDLGSWDLSDYNINLWMPIGYGDQHLYTVEFKLLGEVQIYLR